MKQFYVRDAASKVGQDITSRFVVVTKQTRTKKNGEPYVHFLLADRTGSIEGKLWEDVDQATAISPDTFVMVDGRVGVFLERYELTIGKIAAVQEHEIDLADFLPSTSRSVEVLWAELADYIESIENLQLRQLVREFFLDEETACRFRRAPAAQVLHHAFRGGLLEHVVSLCGLCHRVQLHYPWLNRDLLITGAILHDVGKIHELSYHHSLGYTDRGRLVGHISIALQMLHSKVDQHPEFSRELLTLLEHLILSHHGQREFGSPVEPSFPEAMLLHFLDNIDSKLAAAAAGLESTAGDCLWTSRIRSLDRPVLRVSNYLDPRSSKAGSE
jgi:3'-5' exoribonuclease